MKLHVVWAIFRRNFISYFSNPTGYVFIFVFVLMSSLAAFWPNDFFNNNLANLDQLNRYLPYILLIFIPAITMSIWAEERRQGTDELLLTIPAGDFDVVLGKYLAAVGIYTASLVFSAICSFAILAWLSAMELDLGLFVSTYFGYWMVGLAMVAIGMAASFLTGNLTVGFVLGVIFNAPLTFASSADAIALPGWVADTWPNLALGIKRLGVADQFRDFGRGVITFASMAYFLSLTAIMLYLSMVLIGRRHWSGGRDGQSMGGHYLIRFVALLVLVVSLNVFLAHHDRLRVDATSERLSSLSPDTVQLLTKLDAKHPVLVEAYISRSVPENYVPTRLNLLAMLSEIRAVGGDKLQVTVHDNMEPFSELATRAEQQFNIRPQTVFTTAHGVRGTQEEIFMGVAVTCGLEKVVIPFFDRGLPVEYELVRSICTASQQKRKRLGVLTTDAKLFGGFDMSSMGQTPNQAIVDELQKQYEVTQVDPTNPIKERYDVLLAVQPSSLGPAQLDNFVAAVAAGQPTAIFDDPLPIMAPEVPGTSEPKQPPGGQMAMFMRQPPQPKGDINKLWKLLGVDFMAKDCVWQDFNPYPKAGFSREWVFVDPAASGGQYDPFNSKNPITAGLRQVLLPFPGAITGLNSSPLTFSSLMTTSDRSGTVPIDKIKQQGFGGRSGMNPEMPRFEKPTGEKYILAAYIHGMPKADKLPNLDGHAKPTNHPMSDKEPGAEGEESPEAGAPGGDADGQPPAQDAMPEAEMPQDAIHQGLHDAGAKAVSDEADADKKPEELKVVLVADMDCLVSIFFSVRSRGELEDEVDFQMQNVTFVLNALDSLAGDDRFIEIRKRQRVHKQLEMLTQATKSARGEADEKREEFLKEFDSAKAKEQKKVDDAVASLRKGGGTADKAQDVMTAIDAAQKRLKTKMQQLSQKYEREIKEIDHKKELKVRAIQDRYKLIAVLVPPILPLVLAFFVFFNRRAARACVGVSKNRLR